MCWRFCFCMIHNANKFINLIITHLSVNVKQDVADKVMAIKNRFMDKHICSWQESSMSNLWLSMLLLLEYQQLYTIFTLFCHCMSKFPNTKCLFFIYLNGTFEIVQFLLVKLEREFYLPCSLIQSMIKRIDKGK